MEISVPYLYLLCTPYHNMCRLVLKQARIDVTDEGEDDVAAAAVPTVHTTAPVQQSEEGGSERRLCLMLQRQLRLELEEDVERKAEWQQAAARRETAEQRAYGAEQEQWAAEQDRAEKLEHAHELLAANQYSEAMQLLSGWAQEAAGAASQQQGHVEWARDVLFYLAVARCEHGLRDCAFNSEEQHQSITLAFQEAKNVLALFKDKREESREFILSLQNRVFGQCQMQLNEQAELLSFCAQFPSSLWESDEASRQQLMLEKGMQRMWNPDYSEVEVELSNETAEILTNRQTSLCVGLRFLYQLKGEAPVTLLPPAQPDQTATCPGDLLGHAREIMCCHFVLRNTLCLFDRSEYGEIESYCNVALAFIKVLDSSYMLRILDMALPFSIRRTSSSNLSHYYALTQFLAKLLASALYARREFAWRRWAGWVLPDVDGEPDTSAFPLPLHTLRHYMDLFLGAMEPACHNLQILHSGIGNLFTAQSLLDPFWIIRTIHTCRGPASLGPLR